jgi:trehalose 6-phosphate synthase
LSQPTTPRRKLLVVANRAPVVFELGPDGTRVARRGGGGLVTALAGLLSQHEVTWIASAMSDEDRAVAAARGGAFPERARDGAGYRLRLVAHPAETYDRYYNVVANPTLWFLQHYLWGLGTAPTFGPALHEAWRNGYVPVNEAFAEASIEELDRDPDTAVLFHDYHLYLAPRLVREARPDALTSHFVHIPWPEPDYWCALPPELRLAIHEGLLANDVVGFHTDRWRRAFYASCEALLGATVDEAAGTVEHAERRTRVVARPIGIDVAEFEAVARSPEVLDRERALFADRRERVILRVDRIDPAKNIVRGFETFALLLESHPELCGTVTMVALVAPSRGEIAEYVDYAAAVEAAARELNERFGDAGWTPLELDVADDFQRSVAGYKQFDVLFVNSVFDGLNLVAKEGFLVNEQDGVLVLSENAGVHEELAEWAVTVNPLDVLDQTEALHTALTMPAEERRRRAEAIREHVRTHDITEWVDGQLADLDAVRSS